MATPPTEELVHFDLGGAARGDGCGLTAAGSLVCWCNDRVPEPCREVPEGQGWTRVQHAGGWACAEDMSRRLTCWGRREAVWQPPEVPVLDWSIEDNQGCAVLDDRSVSCWGEPRFDLAPDAETRPPRDLEYVRVAVGRNHACAIDTEGEAHCWGSTWNRTPFKQATPGPWDRVVAWHQVACGIRDSDGHAECWHDEAFIYGSDDGMWQLPDERWKDIGLGEWSACGLTLDGRAVCFPAPFDHAGEQYPPDLEDLVLP